MARNGARAEAAVAADGQIISQKAVRRYVVSLPAA